MKEIDNNIDKNKKLVKAACTPLVLLSFPPLQA